MSVVVKITDLNPVYGVIAEGNVTIHGLIKIHGVRLERTSIQGKYRIQLPVTNSTKKSSVDIVDKELKETIRDAMIAQYEKRIRYPSRNVDLRNSCEPERIHTKNSRDFKNDLKRAQQLHAIQ